MTFTTAIRPRRRMKQAIAVLAVLGSVTALSACTIDTSDRGQSEQSQSTAADASQRPAEPKLTSNAKDGKKFRVADLVTVSSEAGVANVTLTDSAGTEVEGTVSKDGKRWTAKDKLDYGTSYTLKAKSKNDEKLSTTFTTESSPAGLTNAAMSPLDGSTVGVGQSVSLQFDTPIKDRKAVEELIDIKTEPKVEGAFYWISSDIVRWRPEKYWAPGTKVTVHADLKGHDLGGGVHGEVDRHASFTIGDETRAVVDDASKTMTVYQNGQVVKTIPVSNGRDGGRWATPNGIYQVGDMYDKINMNSQSFGLALADGGYNTDVRYATQLSYSGIFIHAAPWSEYAQGNTNTSHGCVNVSTANAQWVYNNFKRGDIVEIKNTSGPQLDGHDGLGDWNIDWKTWKAGNANGS